MTSGARVWAEEGCPAPKKEPKTAQVPQRDMTAALSDVIAERRRQIDAEGWSTEHDDEHLPGELALAAASYVCADEVEAPPAIWPWDWAWWKPESRRRNLVKAAALILAEIERLDRAEAAKSQPQPSGD